MSIDVESLREHLTYSPETGALTWRTSGPGRAIASAAGYQKPEGYRGVCLNRKHMLAHRIAWAITHGEWPSHDIDHINGDRSDNRLANLRACSDFQNQGNRPGHGRYAKGVSFFKGLKKPYRARIRVGGKFTSIGFFATESEAAEAYQVAAKAAFGDFAWGRRS